MAIYHLSVQIISRGKGRSAVAAAAYRAGEKLINEYDGCEHDYTKKGGVLHSEIMLPENAPPEFIDRHTLWNSVEKIEKASNSQLAREIDIALPKELSFEENLKLIKEYCQINFIDKGMIADFALHDEHKGNDNIHAHIMLTTRPLKPDGQWGNKEKKDYAKDENGECIPIIDPNTGLQKVDNRNRKQWKREYVQVNDWNNRENVELWREAWSNICNKYLAKNNVNAKIDHRSYKRQGIEKLPTIHMGTAASQMEKRGIATERGNINRAIAFINNKLRVISDELVKLFRLKKDIKEEAISPEQHKPITPEKQSSPTLLMVLQSIVENTNLYKKYGRVRNISSVPIVLKFMKEYNLKTSAQLREKLSSLMDGSSSIKGKLEIGKIQQNAELLIREINRQIPQKNMQHNQSIEK